MAAGEPTLTVVGGLPATGKTTVAGALARQRRAVFVRIDAIEQTIIDQTGLAQPLGPVGYEVGYAITRQQLRLGLDVVAESVNPVRITRDAWRSTATDAGADVVEVEIVCSDPVEHRRRAENRSVDVPGLVLPTWQQILDREYEPWTRSRLVIDTAVTSVEKAVAAIDHTTWS